MEKMRFTRRLERNAGRLEQEQSAIGNEFLTVGAAKTIYGRSNRAKFGKGSLIRSPKILEI